MKKLKNNYNQDIVLMTLNKLFENKFEKEYRFDEKRKWRFDLACPSLKIGIEVQGGIWIGGRHTRAKGYVADMEKNNEAVKQGWRILYYQSYDEVLEKYNDIICVMKSR
jgi:very-short-patch-repair endonuclease